MNNRLTDDRIANAIKEGTFIEMDMRDLKRIKKPSMEELYEKSNRYERIEEELGCHLEEAINILFDFISYTDEFRCITCTNVMANELGCDGNCQNNYTFTRKQLLEKFKIRLSHCGFQYDNKKEDKSK